MSNGALDAVLAAPPLKRITPAAQEAMDSVAELAKKQSEAKQEAAQFSPVVGSGAGVSCSFDFNPVADTVDFESPSSLAAIIKKHEFGFKVSIRFK